MSKDVLLRFMRSCRYAVQASVSPSGAPQAAVVGIAVTDSFEIVFDTLETSRKAGNLRRNSRIAFVIGGTAPGTEKTVQYEGHVDLPRGPELEAIRNLYFEVFPDGRQRLNVPGLVHYKVTPAWLRCSDFSKDPPEITELDSADLARLQ